MIIFVKLKTQDDWSGLSYEMRVIRSVNRLHVNNLRPFDIGGTPSKFLVDFDMKTIYIYIYIYIYTHTHTHTTMFFS